MKGPFGILGNELTDRLAKEAAKDESRSSVFVHFPVSHLKYELKKNLFTNRHRYWDISQHCKNFPKRYAWLSVTFLDFIYFEHDTGNISFLL